jgi:hypothetical protein
MKKLIIVLMCLLPIVAFGQRIYKLDSLLVPTGTDTTVYVKMVTGSPWSIEFDYKALDQVDGTLDMGICAEPDTSVFNSLDDDRLPYTLVDSTVIFTSDNFPGRYLEIKLTKGTNTVGKKVFYWITKI